MVSVLWKTAAPLVEDHAADAAQTQEQSRLQGPHRGQTSGAAEETGNRHQREAPCTYFTAARQGADRWKQEGGALLGFYLVSLSERAGRRNPEWF